MTEENDMLRKVIEIKSEENEKMYGEVELMRVQHGEQMR